MNCKSVVPFKGILREKLNLPFPWEQFAKWEAEQLATTMPNEATDSKGAPDDVPEVSATCDWLEENGTSNLRAKDILGIIKACLKDVKKLKATHLIKVFTQLTTMAEYIKLQDKYQRHSKCTHPCLNASLAIAQCMGVEPAEMIYKCAAVEIMTK